MSFFHKNLEYLMRRQNETQQTVAEFVGVSQPTVSNWLRDTLPRDGEQEKVAQLFEVTVDHLMNHELPFRNEVHALADLDRELKELLKTWNGVANRLRKIEVKQGQTGDYIAAAQNSWLRSGTESCASDLTKIVEIFFPLVKESDTATLAQPSSSVSEANVLTSETPVCDVSSTSGKPLNQ